jgi:hypothetical protein
MARFAYPTPIPARPRRAEQVPLALDNGCDPAAGCGAGVNRVLMRACTVTSPKGPLFRVPARPLRGKELKDGDFSWGNELKNSGFIPGGEGAEVGGFL